MEKINLKSRLLKTMICVVAFSSVVLPATISPANAYDAGSLPVSINQIMMEQGSNIKHGTDDMRYLRNEKTITEDYKQYDRNRNFEGNDGVIQNYNGSNYNSSGGTLQGQVDDIATNGVYINSIEVAPSSVLSQEEVNSIIKPLLGKNVFISDIQRVIDQLNNKYAEKGFVTAKAFLPEQTVENGHIYIELIESKVGNLKVENNKWTRTKYITDRIEQEPGQLFDIVELEQDILDFNRYNEGVNLTANLTAGAEPGTTDITVRANEKFPFHVVGIMDNAGRYQTGRLRGGAMVYADSLFHNRDRLSLGSYFAGGAISPFADYNFPVNKRDGRVGFMFSSTLAKVKWGEYSNDPWDVKSRSFVYSLYYTQPLVRKPGFELKSYVGANYKRARSIIGIDTPFGYFENDGLDEVTSFDIALNLRKDTKHGIWYANQGVGFAVPLWASESDYIKISGGAIRLHDFSHGVVGQMRANYQVIPNNKYVPYIDQFQAGGLNTVRGYSEGMMIGKNGFFVTNELMFPLMPREITSRRTGEKVPFIGRYVKGAVFADVAGIFPQVDEYQYGVGGGTGHQGSYFMASVGMGLRVQLPGDLSARLYWGYPLVNSTYLDTDRKVGRFHFELTMEPNLDALLRNRSTAAKPAPAPAPYVQKEVDAQYNYDDVRHYDYFHDGGGGAL